MDCEELVSKTNAKDALYDELLQLKKKMDHAFQLYSTLKERFEARKKRYCDLDYALAMHDGRRKVEAPKTPKPLPKETKDSPIKAVSDALARMTASERAALLLEIEGGEL